DFTAPCNDMNSDPCISEPPQGQTNLVVDSLGDRMMFRLAYRNFGSHESLVANHTVTAGSSTGIRWYELRNPNATPTVFQKGTFAPDSNFRWMGSIAMDKAGDIAVGYSVSSASLDPSVNIAGRLVGDPLDSMGQGESRMFTGTGAESNPSTSNGKITRWGDYSSMTVDPADDCTFWYVGEYYTTVAVFAWHTRVGHFKFPSCGPDDFTIAVTPPAGGTFIRPGGSADYTIDTAAVGSFTTPIGLAVSGLPAGITATFTPSTIDPGQSSTMTLDVDPAAADAPNTIITITGTASAIQHSALSTVGIGSPPVNTFSLTLDRASGVITRGGTASFTVRTAVVTGDSSEPIALSVGGLPNGVTGIFSPGTIHAGGSSTLTLTASTSAAVGDSSTFTVTGDGTSDSEFASADLSVVGDFALAIAPNNPTVPPGHNQTFTVSATGGPSPIALTIAGALPAGVTSSGFNPTAIVPGTSSTLTLVVAANATSTSNAPFTVKGTDGDGIVHTVTGHLTISVPDDFTLSLSPTASTIAAGNSVTVAISTTSTGTPEPVSLTVSGLPAGITEAFNPATITAGGPSILTLTAAATAAAVSGASFTVTGSAASATHSATGTLTVTAASTPTAVVTNPVSGATVSGTVQIAATATPGAGATLTKIELRVDDTVVGTSTSSPATASWQSTQVPDGAHNITARATDSKGGTTTSAAVTVTVSNGGGSGGGGGCSSAGGGALALLGLLVLCRRRWK
ncbi:MAG: hypothetical protein LC689_20605, partial [Myxococcales bacterium]|nr:hypothetical protein [Myxococcales bacterium]